VEGYHKPVLLQTIVEMLQAHQAKWLCDVTAGDGGHCEAFLEGMPSPGRVIAMDQDPQALARTRQRLDRFGDRLITVRGNFSHFSSLLPHAGRGQVDGILADLGVSTLQISDPAKGFMFSADGPLSMQMDPDSGLTAAEVVNTYEESQLADIIRTYGEERAWRRITGAIVKARRRNPITTTRQLAEIVLHTVHGPFSIKSCARVFQSLRIHVNRELERLEEFLPQAVQEMRPGARLAVLSYHSLEDRCVKNFMRDQAFPCVCPPRLPHCVCGARPTLKLVGKLIVPSQEEIAANPNARSARLRIAEKIQEAEQ